MDLHKDIPLKNYLTMKIGGNAAYMVEVRTKEEIASICQQAKAKNIPIFVLGGGSNVIAKDSGFQGLVIRIRIPGFEVVSDDPGSTTIRIGAGEDWDSVVKRSVDMNLSGIEAMSSIPGTTGATPVQNVGAYGQEIADTLVELSAYDTKEDRFVKLQNSDCKFSYRDSIFRSTEKGRYIIFSVTLKLSKNLPQPPFYASLQQYLDDKGLTTYTASDIRDAVVTIRNQKLPDPEQKPSCGSFFKNAIVEEWQLNDLKTKYPDAPLSEMGDGTYKIPTGWLIDKAGLKGQLLHGMRVSESNALILINESAKSYTDLAAARDEIKIKVRDLFRIEIEQEPIEM